jgi:hypothetical protein
VDVVDSHDGYNYYNHHQNYYGGHVTTVPAYNGCNGGGGGHGHGSANVGSGHAGMPVSLSANAAAKKSSSHGGRPSHCDVCHMTFPSSAVLENHVKGSRHARKLKSQQAFRQLKESGTHFRQDADSGGEIRCEVCQVSVNSSQQLQAHLIGTSFFLEQSSTSPCLPTSPKKERIYIFYVLLTHSNILKGTDL